MKPVHFPFLCCLICVAVAMFSCEKQEGGVSDYKLAEIEQAPALQIDLDSILVEGALGNFKVEKTARQLEEGLQVIHFTFTSDLPAELPPVSLEFRFPSVDIQGFWNPNVSMDKVNYYKSGITAKAARYAPVLSFYNSDQSNRITFALSDALNQSDFSSLLKEETVYFEPKIKLFTEKMPKTKRYEVDLRIDTRAQRYVDAISDVANWWAEMPEYQPMQVPETAKRPMYSTWYSYHQGISADEIVAECKLAKALGCEAVIVDDGWQTKDGNRGYAYTGDWKPDRIPEMKEFVEAVHQEGMQFLLWYSLPFMGEKAKNHPRFKGKYLRHWQSQGTYVLDPRYPEVREFIVETYVTALEEWNLDGFKLDFIGWFTAVENTKLTKENGRDYASVNEATDALMTEVTRRLTAAKPDILIEFRQPYIGPLMRKYGNMFRGMDAPNNAVANRAETTNLRLLAGNTAVHSDMIIWHHGEVVEAAALQLLNVLYSVPQISVRLAEIPENHKVMLKHWLGYWNANRDVLIEGRFEPSNPGSNYPLLTAFGNDVQISTVYDEVVVKLANSMQRWDVINGKKTDEIIIVVDTPIEVALEVTNCMGEIVHTENRYLQKGVHQFPTPPSGMVRLTPVSN